MGDNQLYKKAIKWQHINTATAAINRSGQAKLHRIIVNRAQNGTATVYDNPTATGSVVALIDTNQPGTYEYGGMFLSTGLTVVTTAGADITVVYE